MCDGFDPPTNLYTLYNDCEVLQSGVDKAVLQWKLELAEAEAVLRSTLDRQAKANNELWNSLIHENLLTDTA